MKITDKRKDKLKKMVKKINDSLYRLEKSGLALDSKEYQIIQHYATENKLNMYNVNLEKGTIRVSSDLSRFETQADLKKYQDILEGIIASKTRTVTGTRAALKQSFETIKEKMRIRPGSMNAKELDYQQYRNMWRIYRNNVEKNKQKMSSDQVFNILVSEQGFYDLTEEQLEEAFSYYNTYSTEDATDKIYEEYGDLF